MIERSKRILSGLMLATLVVGVPRLSRAQYSWPDGTFLRSPSGDIFVVYGGAAFQIPTYLIPVFLPVPSAAIPVVPWALIPYAALPRDGTLLKEFSHPEVYVFYRGAKLHITSPAVLYQAGFTWNDVHGIPDGTLRSIDSTNGMVWREASRPEVYVSYG